MEIREKIQQKCERIAASIADHGRSDGTEIATQEEMHWLALQMALRGVLFSYSADESTYQNGDESYYYYWTISARARCASANTGKLISARRRRLSSSALLTSNTNPLYIKKVYI